MVSAPKPLPPLIYRSPWKRFLQYELFAAGMLGIACVAALICANTPGLAEGYHAVRTLPITFSAGPLSVSMPLQQWINDVLMCSFFFLVGLQIKYELSVGLLRSPRNAALPIVGALGGMVVPMAIYLAINSFSAAPDLEGRTPGWPVPMSTDIAFVAGCMSVMRHRLSPALMVFMITLAIVDDLGAVAVIGAIQLESLRFGWFLPGGLLVALAWFLGRLGVHSALFFLVLGGFVWACFVLAGIHATVAGVFMAFAVPMRSQCASPLFVERVLRLLEYFRASKTHPEPNLVNGEEQVLVRSIVRECFYVESALQRILYGLEPFCALLVLPAFAFFNSGVSLPAGALLEIFQQPVTLGVFLGLFLGKQAGITLFCWLATLVGLARLPEGVSFRQLWALAWLGGVGFTMALFLTEVAFSGPALDHLPIRVENGETHEAPDEPHATASGEHEDAPRPLPYNEESKAGVFLASLLSGLVGMLLLRFLCPRLDGEGPPGEESQPAH